MDLILTPPEWRGLKIATRQLLAEFENLEDAAQFVRVKPSELSRYQNFDQTAFIPLDVAVILERIANIRHVSKKYQDILGFYASDAHCPNSETLKLVEQVGHLAKAIQESTDHDSPGGAGITEFEARHIQEKLAGVQIQLSEVITAVHAQSVKAAAE